jgi:pimeloyl-ACP methyl ester carboxylesterase
MGNLLRVALHNIPHHTRAVSRMHMLVTGSEGCCVICPAGRPVLALELPHVSQRWVLWVPTVDEVAEVVVSILNRNDISSCCLIGHSYGTAVGSRLLQQVPERIQQLCLIDPICFTMFMPNLLRNFLYESPRSGSWLGDFMMVSAARDLHVSATLSRRFFWSGEPGLAGVFLPRRSAGRQSRSHSIACG